MASTCNRTAMPIADVDGMMLANTELQRNTCTFIHQLLCTVSDWQSAEPPLLVVYQVGGFLRLGAVFLSGRRRATCPMIPADSANRCGAGASADSRCWPVLDGSWRYCHRNGNTVDAPGGWTRKPKLHSSTASTHSPLIPGIRPTICASAGPVSISFFFAEGAKCKVHVHCTIIQYAFVCSSSMHDPISER